MAKPGPKPRIWTNEERAIVQRAAIMNMPQEAIAKLLKTTKSTLELYFRDELDHASGRANMAVLGALYKNAMEGNVAAQIFWCKTRLGMRETSNIELGADAASNLTAVLQVVSKKPIES